MEYIHGLDIKTWITNNTPFKLNAFLVNHLTYFSRYSIDKDYTDTYNTWLSEFDFFNGLIQKKRENYYFNVVDNSKDHNGEFFTDSKIIENTLSFYWVNNIKRVNLEDVHKRPNQNHFLLYIPLLEM